MDFAKSAIGVASPHSVSYYYIVCTIRVGTAVPQLLFHPSFITRDSRLGLWNEMASRKG